MQHCSGCVRVCKSAIVRLRKHHFHHVAILYKLCTLTINRLKRVLKQVVDNEIMSAATGLKSLAPEICSLICQDPFLDWRDLNSICFISPAFRTEAQRLLSYRFPCLRGASPASNPGACLSNADLTSHQIFKVSFYFCHHKQPSTQRTSHVLYARYGCV